jgi:hypothetical protein
LRARILDEDLLRFTKLLIAKTNDIHSQITKNDSVAVVFPYSQAYVFEQNVKGYQNLAEIYPSFAYRPEASNVDDQPATHLHGIRRLPEPIYQ